MRRIWVLGMVLVTLISSSGGFVLFVEADDNASNQRNVLLELFTATWCTGCPFADAASEELKIEYGESVSLLQYHIWDDGFDTPEMDARAEDYDASQTSIPALWSDGVDSKFGAQSESEAYGSYKAILDNRLAVESPLALEIAEANLSGGQIAITVDLTLISTLSQGSFNLRFAIYEDELYYDVPHPNTQYNYVVRKIEVQSVTQSSLPTTVTQTFEFNTSWNYSNMGAVVFAQLGDNGEVLQSHSMSFGIGDKDNDGLPDDWEMLKLNTLLYSGEDDPDGDGITNTDEYLNHTDPLKKDIREPNYEYVWYGLGGALIAVFLIAGALALRGRSKGKVEDKERK